MITLRTWTLRVLLLALLTSSSYSAQQSTTAPVVLSGKYADLHPEQKRLVDDWFRRFSEVVKKEVSPEEGYNNLPLSVKTTFSAVTHALLRTPLTDESGASLGDTAMTLVAKVDQALGRVEGAGGDKQFRIYVELKSNALEILGKSKEFKRMADNTVYHKGFPTCFRTDGTPSIQVSITRDGKRADIDVDYRSSKFPVALINGHLSASNSDIRAGNNDERHNGRWAGVSNWWRSLLGLPLTAIESVSEDEGVNNPPIKTKANVKPAVAIHDFFQTWLVDQKPEEVLSYFTDTAFSCMEIERGQPTDHGVVRFVMLRGLHQINESMGKVTDLSQAMIGRYVKEPRVRVIEHPNQNQFVLYDVREDLAEQFNCGNRLDPSLMSPKAARSESFGKYVGAIFQLKSQGLYGEIVATLWAKQKGYWKLISYATEPERDETRSATVAAAPVEELPLATDPGNTAQLNAARDFYQKWFLRRRADQAFQYLSPRSYVCAKFYRDEASPEPATAAEAEQLIQAGMKRVADMTGPARKLSDVITTPQPSHPDLRLVKHVDSPAFAVVAIPDSMALDADCSKMRPGEELNVANSGSASKNYGEYYATGFRLAKSADQANVLWTVWGRENNEWKIIAYHVLTP